MDGNKCGMEEAFDRHGVKDYFELFNRFGQTGEPTFSWVRVSTDAIEVATYTVDDEGRVGLFDEIRVVLFSILFYLHFNPSYTTKV